MIKPGEWIEDALCRQGDWTIWFPDDYRKPANSELPKAWCRMCPVLERCREYVLAVEDGVTVEHRNGVWAALTPQERFDIDRSSRTVA